MKLFVKILFRSLILLLALMCSVNLSYSAKVGIAKVHGKIVYNDNPVNTYTNAYAKLIGFYSKGTRINIEVDFQYNNQTGEYEINNVPPGVYHFLFYIDAGPPFGIKSPGDFDNIWSELVDDIEVAPHRTDVYLDLRVKYNIRIVRPIDMTDYVKKTRPDKPFEFYESIYYPSASTFEWGKVPGASYYIVYIGLWEESKRINLITKRVFSPQISPQLQLTSGRKYYSFYIHALNNKDKKLGDNPRIFSKSYGGSFNFIILPKEKHGGFQKQ